MIPVLHRHNAILEAQISQHGGRILELHGDGIKAVFENGAPLDCAIAIQAELGRESWGPGGELRVRVGLHSDTAAAAAPTTVEATLAQAADITSAAWGGQILVSESIHNTLDLPNGAIWQDFGQRQLPNANKPLHLYGLLHPDLRYQNFAPLRSPVHPSTNSIPLTPASPHNLPQQPNTFIGRKLELAALDELMADPEIRLVTIVGPGGMGKTRLALAAAERQLGQTAVFPHGVFFIPLAHLQTADQIVPALAHALSLPIDGGWQENRVDGMPAVSLTAQRQLLDYLRHKQMLLLMDNFEHLLDGAALLTEILQTAANVQILVTSRERLQLREEQVYPIQGLGIPDRATVPLNRSSEDVMQYTAVQLFLQSARRVQPNFELTADDLIYLTRICRAVGGMPLGLELAASWVDMLSLQDIAAEIHGSLDLLETDVRNMPERHRSVRVVFDYSWQQLSPKEQEVFAQFAAFRGGFSRVAAQKITGANIRTLSNLVNKSFLQYNQHRDRYELHELMRQYAAEKLAEDAEQETAVRDKHSAYYCIALQYRENELRAGHPQSAMQQIDADQENVRAAWHWAVEQAHTEHIDLAVNGLCLYYDWLDRLRSGLVACEAATRRLRQLPPTADNQRILAKVITWYGRFIGFIEQAGMAQQLLEEAANLLESAEQAGQDVRSEQAYHQLIASHFFLDAEVRQEYLEKSLALFRQLGDQWGEFSVHTSLGNLARRRGNYYEAKHWFEKNLRLAREQHNQWEIILAINQLGWVARSMAAYEEAQHLFEQSLTLARTQNSPWAIVRGLESSGYLALFQGSFEDALRCLQEAITIGRENGMRGDVINHLAGMSIAYWLSGRFDEAFPLLLEAQKAGKALGHPWAVAFPTVHLGELQILTGQYEQGREQVQSALLLIREAVANTFVTGRVLRAMGWYSLTEGHFGEAQDWFEQSIEEYQKMMDDEAIIWSTAGLSHALLGLGNVAKARTALVDALWTAVEIQSFIPLLFLLPVTALLLHEQGEEAWTNRLHTLALRVPFLANAHFFDSLVWSKLPPLPEAPRVAAESSAELRRELWTAVSQLLAEDVLAS
jgi:predicted ATPase